jgi:methionyl-tRNA formyltransferase
MNRHPRVLLVGIGPTAASAFCSLRGSCELTGVVRGNNAADDPVRQLAREASVPLHEDASLAALEALVHSVAPDCVVISSYDRIIGAELLARCPFLNVHYSPLPRYRGRANVNWAILNGEPSAAITVHRLEAGLDAGNILFQKAVPISGTTTVTDLYDALNEIQREALGPSVLRFLGGYAGMPQDAGQATYGCTRVPDDGQIDWSASTVAIDRLVRALTPPYPGAFTWFKGRQLRVWHACVPAISPSYVGRVPGRVIRVNHEEGWVDVLTGDGVLRLLEVQAEGCEIMKPAILVRSTKSTLGLSTAELLRRVATLEATVARLTERLEGSLAAERAGGRKDESASSAGESEPLPWLTSRN